MESTKVADAASSDLVEPPSNVLSVEVREATVDDQKHILHEVFSFGVRATQRARPAIDVVEEPLIYVLEVHRWRSGRPGSQARATIALHFS